jgi:dihydropteroate synthase
MRKFLTALSLIVLISACSNNDSLENQGQKAGAAADKAIERVDKRIDAEQDNIDVKAENVREKARDVKADVEKSLEKIDNAADAAEAELKK